MSAGEFTGAGRPFGATVQGEVNDTKIKFRKTYDGTGDVRHSVDYEGDYKSTGRELSGIWELTAMRSLRGGFSAVAIGPQEILKAGKRVSFCPTEPSK